MKYSELIASCQGRDTIRLVVKRRWTTVEWVMKDANRAQDRRQVLGVVFPLRLHPRRRSWICWREISEDLFPPYTDCPAHILRLLTPNLADTTLPDARRRAQQMSGHYGHCRLARLIL